MPINLKTPESIIIDKVKIDFNDVVIPENLYTSVKDFLYNLLDNSL